jgi:hypothetical protein
MVFGLVIDSACLVKQATCGREGACLLYGRSDFRLKYHGFAAAVKFGATVAFSIGWWKIRHMNTPLLSLHREVQDEKKPRSQDSTQSNRRE